LAPTVKPWFLTFSPPFGESQIHTKLPTCLVSGKTQKYFSFPTHKQERIKMTEKFQKFPCSTSKNTMSELLKKIDRGHHSDMPPAPKACMSIRVTQY
jgi:hypothetical protein